MKPLVAGIFSIIMISIIACDETELTSDTTPPEREIIGQWLDERPFVASQITIFSRNEKLFMERKFEDGSSLDKALREQESALGRRFDEVEGSITGDHYVIGPDGNLQIRDNDGLITMATKIE